MSLFVKNDRPTVTLESRMHSLVNSVVINQSASWNTLGEFVYSSFSNCVHQWSLNPLSKYLPVDNFQGDGDLEMKSKYNVQFKIIIMITFWLAFLFFFLFSMICSLGISSFFLLSFQMLKIILFFF